MTSKDAAGKIAAATERARREAVVTAMLAERDRQRPMSLEEVLQARDEVRL